MRKVIPIIGSLLILVIFAILFVLQTYKNSPEYNYITAKLDMLIFSKENCRTASLNKAILLIMNTDKGFGKQKTGELFRNLTYTGPVESIGVEPTTSCMPCKRSSQLS